MRDPVRKLGEEKVTRILQTKELSILKDVKSILESNGIPFYLACGTALGCARHRGFIPWDDDVDIYIYGTDYSKVKKAINSAGVSNLEFHDHSNQLGYPYWFPKIVSTDSNLIEDMLNHQQYICGVNIDVFPIYGASDNVIIRLVQESVRYFRYAIIRAYYNESFQGGIRGLLRKIARDCFDPVKIQYKLERTYTKPSKGSKYFVDAGIFHKKALLKQRVFRDSINMQFEDTVMPMPKGFKSYLKDYYGNYMELPPEKERISHHPISMLEIYGVEELMENHMNCE